MIFAVVGMTVGAFVPMLWGDNNTFGLASIACSTLFGFLGIWLAVKLSQ